MVHRDWEWLIFDKLILTPPAYQRTLKKYKQRSYLLFFVIFIKFCAIKFKNNITNFIFSQKLFKLTIIFLVILPEML